MESKLVRILLICCIILGKINLLLAIKSYEINPAVLEIYEISINSDIDSRYARTTVVKRLENKGETEQNVTYSVVFPEEAYASSFILEVNGKNYTAFITGRIEDKNEQDATAISKELNGITERDSNKFSLRFTVKPSLKIAFYLTYEQLLQRQYSRYEHVINLQTDQPIPSFNVQVEVAEKSSLINLKAITRICKEVTCKDLPVDSNEISKHSSEKVTIKPTFTLEKQNQFSELSESTKGFKGQFVVQYDVERNTTSGQILTNNGYCVHFFAPNDLLPMPKYVVFILDTSLSMRHQRLVLLKNAMDHILEKLHADDLFSIVEFNTIVKAWYLNKTVTYYPFPYYPSRASYNPIRELDFKNFDFPEAYQVNAENINKAKVIICDFKATGVTNMYSALRVGLHMVELARDRLNNRRPIIVFLTDGEPTIEGRITKDVIMEEISDFNVDARKSSIYTLAFGSEPDYHFLEKLAKRNGGFAKQIYDASDASQQLQEFYDSISSPILTNVTLQYDTLTEETRTSFPTVFNGTEIVVAGKCEGKASDVIIEGQGVNGKMTFTNPAVQQTETDIKRMHAYITISQSLEDALTDEEKEVEYLKKAHDLAIANSFSTYVTSLVARTPDNGKTVINPQSRRRGPRSAVSFPGNTPSPFDPSINDRNDKTSSRSNWSSLCLSLQIYLLFISFRTLTDFLSH